MKIFFVQNGPKWSEMVKNGKKTQKFFFLDFEKEEGAQEDPNWKKSRKNKWKFFLSKMDQNGQKWSRMAKKHKNFFFWILKKKRGPRRTRTEKNLGKIKENFFCPKWTEMVKNGEKSKKKICISLTVPTGLFLQGVIVRPSSK